MVDELESRVDLLKREVDALQIIVMTGRVAWYKSPSIVISALALLFSFGTTAVSLYRSSQEDVRSARTELRGILQRLTYLPRDDFELRRKYPNDAEGGALSAIINHENSLLARQASEIVDRFPGRITASEYLSVAVALGNASDVEKVPNYLDRALAQTADPNVKVAILRVYGRHLFTTGEVMEGRRRFERALNIWGDYDFVPKHFKTYSDGVTELMWAQAEFTFDNITEAKDHVRKALDLANDLPAGPQADDLKLQGMHFKGRMETGIPLGPQSASGAPSIEQNQLPVIGKTP